MTGSTSGPTAVALRTPPRAVHSPGRTLTSLLALMFSAFSVLLAVGSRTFMAHEVVHDWSYREYASLDDPQFATGYDGLLAEGGYNGHYHDPVYWEPMTSWAVNGVAAVSAVVLALAALVLVVSLLVRTLRTHTRLAVLGSVALAASCIAVGQSILLLVLTRVVDTVPWY